MFRHFSSSVGLQPQILAYARHYPISQWLFAPQGILFTSELAQCTSDQTPPPQANIPTVDVYGMFDPSNSLDNQHNTGPTQPCFSFESYEDVPRFETSPTTYDQYTSDSSYYAYVQHLTRAAWAYIIAVRSCPL